MMKKFVSLKKPMSLMIVSTVKKLLQRSQQSHICCHFSHLFIINLPYDLMMLIVIKRCEVMCMVTQLHYLCVGWCSGKFTTHNIQGWWSFMPEFKHMMYFNCCLLHYLLRANFKSGNRTNWCSRIYNWLHTCKTDFDDFKTNVFTFTVTVRPHN